jgi:carboxyl-terminal processing protease
MLKKIFYSRFFAGAIFGTLALTLLSTGGNRYLEISKNMEIFAEVYKTVNYDYVEDVDANALMRTAIDSMLNDLDPYTNFFSEAQMEQLRIDVVGGWDGIGIETESRNGEIVVRDVVEETPAMQENIRIGDVIRSVDGKSTQGKKAEDVDKILNGKAGTKVEILVYRPSSKTERSITLERAKISRKNVPYYGMLSDNETGYVILTTFSERAGGNVNDAIKALQEEHKPKQFIIDLRNNGGGYLIEAVNICNIFVGKGKEIVSTRNKVTDWDRSFKTLNNPTDLNVPVIVLINERSASASEIVAGALQDLDRALLVGRKSFGKGLVQNTKDIGYSSKIKLTTAKYYIPSKRCIQALEYKDGTTVQIADSLKKAFKTENGRTVYDGGGLIPDYKIEKTPESAAAQALVKANFISDFANLYRQQNDSIAPAKAFKLTAAEYDNFVKFVAERKYDFPYMTQEAALKINKDHDNSEIKTLAKNLSASLDQRKIEALTRHKAEIIRLLETEIVGRYYFERGKVEIQLREDNDVKEAIKLFNDKERFKQLLSGK